ncbi:uncharacterized protein DCS_08066 [Drechmeria coniospora]|uniref:Increased loss of mitochondrial DNA protein 1 n=1 Tax=Drechmeria coniospora TaxID=98403 RepID=A0A151GG73_DRECN|nr:uncharacterized protein DCS_08066 [Drechmeria coniospora]KYK56100.1 uncharacterized protein DCS_08066 [Drechmeria coniospora]ODA77748.1 hypothetical protein RJ55_06350 [Drechmeria coniospora]
MPLIASNTIITSISLFHLTLAFFFLTSPQTISDQVLVYIMGESMRMPETHAFDAQSPALAFLATLLAFLGLSDLVSLSMPEELGSLYYWGTQAPLRSFFSMLLVFYTYFFSPSSPLYTSSIFDSRANLRVHPSDGSSSTSAFASTSASSTYRPSAWGGEALKNRVFFTFVFLEMITWFWIWVTLREERPEVVKKMRDVHDKRTRRVRDE